MTSLAGHDGNFVADIEFSADSRYLATTGGMIILLWDLARATSGMAARVLRGHDHTVKDLLFLPNSRLLASAGSDAHVRLWGLDEEPVILPDHEDLASSYYYDFEAVFSDDGRRVATSSRTLQKTRVWDLRERAPGLSPLVLEGKAHMASKLAFSADGNRLVGSDAQDFIDSKKPRSIWVWSLGPAEGGLAAPLTVDTGMPLIEAGISRTGELIAVASEEAVWLWKATESDLVSAGKLPLPKVRALAFDPLGKRLITGSASGEVHLWELDASGAPRSSHLLGKHKRDVMSVVVSEDGRWFAAAGYDHEATMWQQAADGSFRQVVLSGHSDWISALAFSEKNELVSGGADGTARFWQVDPRDLSVRSTELRGHNGLVFDVAVRGNLIVTGGMDRTARLWRRDSQGAVVSVLLPGHTGYVRRVRISKDGARVLTASFDGAVRIWRARIDDLLEAADRRAIRNLCDAEWSRHMGEAGPHRPTFPRLTTEESGHVEAATCNTTRRGLGFAITGRTSGKPEPSSAASAAHRCTSTSSTSACSGGRAVTPRISEPAPKKQKP
ncbi:WD40 repeat domain-containing protein [Aquabacterium humicola]|uniref:WD40 repeat domain-containing protein n=1 Tax=Aquabacterium humicola TaxID=3237377 RepID=UPI002542E5E5|nr:WD40 repeat domain-containing protein [Rubrivivax pictus]